MAGADTHKTVTIFFSSHLIRNRICLPATNGSFLFYSFIYVGVTNDPSCQECVREKKAILYSKLKWWRAWMRSEKKKKTKKKIIVVKQRARRVKEGVISRPIARNGCILHDRRSGKTNTSVCDVHICCAWLVSVYATAMKPPVQIRELVHYHFKYTISIIEIHRCQHTRTCVCVCVYNIHSRSYFTHEAHNVTLFAHFPNRIVCMFIDMCINIYMCVYLKIDRAYHRQRYQPSYLYGWSRLHV